MKCYKQDYPRPQFVRNNWYNLNGVWDFAFDDCNQGEKEQWYMNFPGQMEIIVPFTFETEKSGIGDEQHHDNIWYQRAVYVNGKQLKSNKYVIHFEGSDFKTKLWVNGQYVGVHIGGYTRFSFDVTTLIKDGENIFTVKVEDSFDHQYPRGKQRWAEESFQCWYVQTTGIWKTVWSELVPEISILNVKMTPSLLTGCLDVALDLIAPKGSFSDNLMIEAEVTFEDRLINKISVAAMSGHVNFSIEISTIQDNGFEWGIRTWSPETPELYDICFRVIKNENTLDEVGSYFGMREIEIDGQNILLNGKPLYQKLILDQGYWKDSHLTPPDEEALIKDIERISELGYNGLRKHQKIEDERFLYWCDVKGMLVWGEAPAAYRFTDESQSEFTKEWLEMVRQNYNHPCVIVWTPFNESWGISGVKSRKDMQHFTEAIYHLTKGIDPFRPVITNDGWEHTVSDIITLHDYEEDGETLGMRYLEFMEQILKGKVYHNKERAALADGYVYHGQPVIISEFGGIAFDNGESGWGYGNKVKSQEEFIRRFDKITTAIKNLPFVCGYCYTQLTDVQQEVNGLLDMKRNYKVKPEQIQEINERMAGYRRCII